MRWFYYVVFAGCLLANPSVAKEKFPVELCQIMGLVSTMHGKDGPLKGCRDGDVAHFQIDKTLVSPGAVAARYCDFNSEIIVDTLPNNSISHLVCKYKWKWGKQVEMKKHPDAR